MAKGAMNNGKVFISIGKEKENIYRHLIMFYLKLF